MNEWKKRIERLRKLENADEVDLGVWLAEYQNVWKSMPAERRAYLVVREYLDHKNTSEKQRKDFLLWLTSEKDAEIKEKVLERALAVTAREN